MQRKERFGFTLQPENGILNTENLDILKAGFRHMVAGTNNFLLDIPPVLQKQLFISHPKHEKKHSY